MLQQPLVQGIFAKVSNEVELLDNEQTIENWSQRVICPRSTWSLYLGLHFWWLNREFGISQWAATRRSCGRFCTATTSTRWTMSVKSCFLTAPVRRGGRRSLCGADAESACQNSSSNECSKMYPRSVSLEMTLNGCLMTVKSRRQRVL